MHNHTLYADAIAHDHRELHVPRGLHGWDPRLKLFLLVSAVSLNVVLAIGWLSFLLFLTGAGLAVWSRIRLRHFALFFLAPAWATLLVFLGFSVGFGSTPVFSVGPLTVYEEGLAQGLSAAARVASDMSWMAVVFLTTPFTQVLEALRWYRVPSILVETLGLAYRYAFLLLEQFQRLRDVSRVKGGFRTYLKALRTTALILAKVLIRAYDRAASIQVAMVARGSAASQSDVPGGTADTEACPNECDVTPLSGDPSMPVLQCVNLSHTYGSSGTGVKGISFSVTKGEVVVVCGPNGAGKTTLLKLLSGILQPREGEVYLGGTRLDRKTKNEAFRSVGILFEDPHDQLFCTHVNEDVAYGPKNLGLDDGEVDRLVETTLELMEVAHLAHRPIHMLSHGEMKRVGLAGLIAMRPPLLLLDEPTAGLDPASADHLVGLIRHLNQHHGYTFVIVTHAIDIAPVIANRMIVLRDGGVEADGSVRDILTDVKLLERCRLEPPVLTKLFQEINGARLDATRIPITIHEAVEILKSDSLAQDTHEEAVSSTA